MKKIMTLAAIGTFLAGIAVSAIASERESEHPPLPESTKRAIAKYKRNPTEENKTELLKVMNKNYDAIIQQKKDKLAERVESRDKNINRWLGSVRSGGLPPFMTLNTENHKGNERKTVAEAVAVYRQYPSSQNEKRVKAALEVYYNAFIIEQQKHIKETEDSREDRMKASLARFTSDRFRPGRNGDKSIVNQKDALMEIVASYLSSGAEIVPVNPEARVRERGCNSAINTAQTAYFNDPSIKNQAALRAEIAKAFQAAYDVRLYEIDRAEKKGLAGSNALWNALKSAEFREGQFKELTQQRNLYGRIDRMATFGSNTAGNWMPRMQAQSQELTKLLQGYDQAREQQTKTKFNEAYMQMLKLQKEELTARKAKLNSFVEATLKELTD